MSHPRLETFAQMNARVKADCLRDALDEQPRYIVEPRGQSFSVIDTQPALGMMGTYETYRTRQSALDCAWALNHGATS